MSSRREVRAGENITLRARFLDDLQEQAQASGVIIYIFDSDNEDFDFSTARVNGDPTTYFDKGIHEYKYTVPHDGPDGIWTDIWEGTLNSQTLSGVFTFEVSASGVVQQLGSQLNKNNFVEIGLPSGILATDGSALDDEEEYSFLTEIFPAYSNVRKVRLEAGRWITDIKDDTLQLAILEASLEADILSFAAVTNKKLFEHARREWVTCKAGLLLLSNNGNTSLRSKTVADISVTYDTRAIMDSVNRLQDCVARWEPQIIAGGGAARTGHPAAVVKGADDPDRPLVGRDWYTTNYPGGDNRYPLANTKVKEKGSRRARSTWVRRIKNRKLW